MEAAEQRWVIYDTEVNVQRAINLIFVLPRKVSPCAKTSVIKTAKADSNLEMWLSERIITTTEKKNSACLIVN